MKSTRQNIADVGLSTAHKTHRLPFSEKYMLAFGIARQTVVALLGSNSILPHSEHAGSKYSSCATVYLTPAIPVCTLANPVIYQIVSVREARAPHFSLAMTDQVTPSKRCD